MVLISDNKETRWGYQASYVIVEGLEIRNAYTTETFVDSNGKRQSYADNAAALYVERGEHITVRGCILHGSGNGLFVASGGEEAMQSRDILVDENYIYGNGSTGDRKDRHHNIYTEAIGMVSQYNRLGSLRDGAGGHALKDRSAGTVIRYNWIAGGARSMDLVEPEESHAQAVKVPRFGRVRLRQRVRDRPRFGFEDVPQRRRQRRGGGLPQRDALLLQQYGGDPGERLGPLLHEPLPARD